MTHYLDRNFSRLLLISLSLIYLVDVLFANRISNLFTLIPYNVTGIFELWRVITFPLANSGFEDFLLFFMSFFIIAPHLEKNLDSKLFSKILVLLALLQGLIFCLVFYASKVPFAGMEALSIFVLTFHSLREKNSRAKLFNKFELPVYFVTSTILLSWILIKANQFLFFDASNIGYFASTLIFGISSGFVINMFVEHQEKSIDNNLHFDYAKWDLPEEDDDEDHFMTPALISQTENTKKFNQRYEEENKINDWDLTPNEDKLNQILDKINEFGKDSLTEYEIEYLQSYSKQM